MKAIILAAGIGSRLGSITPKCLSKLPDNRSILENQLEVLKANNIKEIIIIVGFKKELIMEAFPGYLYKYNPSFHLTNTSKSLLVALESVDPDDIIWINGDVYLENGIIEELVNTPGNVIAVNTSRCGEEEVKYKTDENGRIVEISKTVVNAEGESLGINKISKDDVLCFIECLKQCENSDYFEKGIEFSIESGLEYRALDISNYNCIEIDFEHDLTRLQVIA